MKHKSLVKIAFGALLIIAYSSEIVKAQTTYNVSSRMRIKSAGGYIDVGAQNNQWGHIYTDRPNFIFNKDIWSYKGGFSSYSSNNLFLRTNGSTRLTILNSNGNVGIGTSSPSYKLHTKGDVYADGGWMRVSGQKGVYFQTYGGGFYMLDNSWIRTYGNKNFYHNTGIMRTDGTFQVGGNGDRFVVQTNGNVGIGSTSPQEKLHINGAVRGNQGGALRINSGNGYLDVGAKNTSHAHFETDRSNFYFNKKINVVSGMVSSYNEDLQLQTQGTTRLTLYNDSGDASFTGKVGIGTSTPDAKLTVKGNIHAEKVTVDLNIPAPDYVFESNYDLRSLEETDQYIKANKHLPEVPSAKELEASGIDLVAMNMLLLKKIEELTLHQIQQQKEIDAIKKENQSFKQVLSRQK